MREMVLKNLISEDKRRREIFLSERTERKNVVQALEKKTVCEIKEILEITQDFDLELFLQQKKAEGCSKPTQTFIIRIYDTKEEKDKFIYKVIGDQYLVVEDKIFLLHVVKYFKIEILCNLIKNAT
jgi:hypothetical protein